MPTISLLCLRGSRAGAQIDLGDPKLPVLLGRSPESPLELDAEMDSVASSRHAELQRVDGRYYVTDLGSRNGTWVGIGGPLSKVDVPMVLEDGMVLALGADGPLFRVVVGPTASARVAREAEGPLTVGSVTPPPPAAPARPTEPPPRDLGVTGDTGGRTAIYQSMWSEQLRRGTRPLWWLVAVLAVLLVTGAVLFGFYFIGQRELTQRLAEDAQQTREDLVTRSGDLHGALGRTQADLDSTKSKLRLAEEALVAARDSLVKTSGDLTTIQTAITSAQGDAKRQLETQAAALEAMRVSHTAQLGRTEAELARLRANEHVAEAIVKDYELALFMLIVAQRDGTLEGFCTAFTVDKSGVLATNAHCLEVIDGANKDGLTIIARMNRRADRSFRVIAWKGHAGYDGSAFSNDVGLVRVDLADKTLPSAVPIAAWIDLLALAGGQSIYTIGFPGKVMNPDSPSADMRAAVISRVTDFSNAPGMPGDNRMVWHSALTTKGTSGSPIFNASGQLVAINNGVLSAKKVMVPGDRGGMREDIAYDASGLNFGVRADALAELIDTGLP